MGAFEESKLNHFVVVNPGDKRLREAFFQWCKENNEPFVCVERHRRFSSVTLDMITCNRYIVGRVQEELKQIVRRYSEEGAFMSVSSDSISTSKVLNERAESLAGILYAGATSPVRMKGELNIPLASESVN